MDFSNKKSLINVFRLLIKLLAFVGVTRLELATSRPPDAYSNQLSYTPINFSKALLCFSKAMQR